MKNMRYLILGMAMLCAGALSADEASKIRVVNFKTCVEKSKVGKTEQEAFEALKKQMEGNLVEREKTLNEMATKFEDHDYLDSLSADAETELKRKFRTLNQEYTSIQSQYMQALQQTNYKVVQKLTDVVSKAAAQVAQKRQLDLILNDEACFFASPSQDISNEIIAVMDDLYEKDPSIKEGAVPKLPAN